MPRAAFGQLEERGLIRSEVRLADGLAPAGPASSSVSEPAVLDGPATGSESPISMRTFAQLSCLTLGAAALAGIAGLASAAVIDPGSALVIAVVVAIGTLVIGVLEWTHRHGSGVDRAPVGADLGVSAGRDRVTGRGTLIPHRTQMLPAFGAVLATSPEASLSGPARARTI